MRKKAPTYIIKMMVANIDGLNRYVYVVTKVTTSQKEGSEKLSPQVVY